MADFGQEACGSARWYDEVFAGEGVEVVESCGEGGDKQEEAGGFAGWSAVRGEYTGCKEGWSEGEEREVTIEYRGERFAGYNKPKRTPGAKKSHAVLAKEGGQVKLIRFGQQGVSGSPKKAGESEAYRKRRESFKARHAKNIAKGKMSAAYWADRVKW